MLTSIFVHVSVEFSLFTTHLLDASQPKEVQHQSILSLQETEPDVDVDTGEWSLSCWDVECISIGAGILGCGGGGSPYLGKLSALQQLKEGKKIKVIAPERYVNIF